VVERVDYLRGCGGRQEKPRVLRSWFAPETVPSERDFMQEIYATLTRTYDLSQ